MGLDTCAARPEGGLTDDGLGAFAEADLKLVSGISSLCDGEFRGEAFERCDPVEAAGAVEYGGQPTPDEVVALRHFFKICAGRGLGLRGWW